VARKPSDSTHNLRLQPEELTATGGSEPRPTNRDKRPRPESRSRRMWPLNRGLRHLGSALIAVSRAGDLD
jgi:hypothetical protein